MSGGNPALADGNSLPTLGDLVVGARRELDQAWRHVDGAIVALMRPRQPQDDRDLALDESRALHGLRVATDTAREAIRDALHYLDQIS
jgi:hypothetical protein